MTRLNLLRLNTMPALDPARARRRRARCAALDNAALRELGRLPVPMLRERGDRGFRRITWDEALRAHRRAHPRAAAPRAHRLLPDLARRHQRDLLRRAEGRALPRHQQRRQRRAPLPLAVDRRDEAARSASPPRTCSYRDWCGTDLIVFFGSNPANDQPVAMKYLHEAKRRGTKVVLVNPYREPGMERYWVPSTPRSALFGTDIADYWFGVATGRRHRLPLRRAQDPDRAAAGTTARSSTAHTTGFDELAAAAARPRLAGARAPGRPAARQHGGVRRADPRRRAPASSSGAWASRSTPSAATPCR